MTEFFPAPLGPSHPPPKEWSADSLILLFILCGQIEINLHTQKILFRLKLFAPGNLRVQIISYLPQVGQIISYLPKQNKY